MSAEVTSPAFVSRGLSASEKEICSAMARGQEPSASSVEGMQTRGRKRLLEQTAESEHKRPARRPAPAVRRQRKCSLQLSLFVRWHSPMGKTKVMRLQLRSVGSVEALQGISKNLVTRAFPDYERPDYLTSADFFKFTPTEQFMSLPGDIARTEFRLVASYNGWEYTVLERELGAHRDPSRKMLVTVIEFESTAMMIGQLGVRVSLIAYPVVSIKKAFLEDIEHQLKTNPDFKGIL
ncbi:hypothetical protein WJX81_006655 [Elliptochloris bilobata]|uniref:Uncharacterized protein n=1 Tax=Elliptochloris bilobata TaxID=381761 RepID=A0AAW1QJ19_9CHLO